MGDKCLSDFSELPVRQQRVYHTEVISNPSVCLVSLSVTRGNTQYALHTVGIGIDDCDVDLILIGLIFDSMRGSMNTHIIIASGI